MLIIGIENFISSIPIYFYPFAGTNFRAFPKIIDVVCLKT